MIDPNNLDLGIITVTDADRKLRFERCLANQFVSPNLCECELSWAI